MNSPTDVLSNAERVLLTQQLQDVEMLREDVMVRNFTIAKLFVRYATESRD